MPSGFKIFFFKKLKTLLLLTEMILYEKNHRHKKFVLWEHVLLLYHWVPLMLLGSYSLGIGKSAGE